MTRADGDLSRPSLTDHSDERTTMNDTTQPLNGDGATDAQATGAASVPPTAHATEAADTTTASAAPVGRPSRPVLPATIVWGVILLVLAALYSLPVFFDVNVFDSPRLLVWGVVGLGALFVVLGIAAALRRRP